MFRHFLILIFLTLTLSGVVYGEVEKTPQTQEAEKPDKTNQNSDMEKEQQKLIQAKISNDFERWNFIIFYSTADEAEYDGTVSNLNFREKDKADPSFGVGLSYSKHSIEKLGYEIGLTYDFKRTFKSYDLTINSTDYSGSYDDKPTLSIFHLYATGNYTFNNGVYLFLGVGYPLFKLDANNVKVSGTMGTLVGVGYLVNENIHIELASRALRANGIYNDGTYSGDIDDAEFEGAMFVLKYNYN